MSNLDDLQEHVNVLTAYVNRINDYPAQNIPSDGRESLSAGASARILNERFDEIPDEYKPAVRTLIDGVRSFLANNVRVNVDTGDD